MQRLNWICCIRSVAGEKKKGTTILYLVRASNLIDKQISFVEKQLLAESNPCDSIVPCTIQWKGSLMELVELVYALHEAGCFGTVSLKLLFAFIGKVFGCEIPNYYRLFWDIPNRAGDDRTFFLNKLRKALSDKLIRKDKGKRQ
jgi:hypothetical protein